MHHWQWKSLRDCWCQLSLVGCGLKINRYWSSRQLVPTFGTFEYNCWSKQFVFSLKCEVSNSESTLSMIAIVGADGRCECQREFTRIDLPATDRWLVDEPHHCIQLPRTGPSLPSKLEVPQERVHRSNFRYVQKQWFLLKHLKHDNLATLTLIDMP